MMLVENELRELFKDDYDNFMNSSDIRNKGVVFCAALTNVKTRALENKAQKQSISGYFNAITEKLGSIFKNNYIAMLEDGSFRIMLIQKQNNESKFLKSDFKIEYELADHCIRVYLKSLRKDAIFDTGEIYISHNLKSSQFAGRIKDLLKCFCTDLSVSGKTDNLSEKFYDVVRYKYSPTEEDPFSFRKDRRISSLLSYSYFSINLLNGDLEIYINSIAAWYECEGFLSLLCFENDEPALYQFIDRLESHSESNRVTNLISINSDGIKTRIPVEFSKSPKLLQPENTLMFTAISNEKEQFLLFIVDNLIYCGKGLSSKKGSFFIFQDKVCILFEDRTYMYVKPTSKIIEVLTKFELSRDEYFRDFNNSSTVFIEQENSLFDFRFNDTGFSVGDTSYSYSAINEIKVETNELSSILSFSYEEKPVRLISSKVLIYELWNRIEKNIAETILKSTTIQGLYQQINDARVNRLLLGTFGEIAKANHIINPSGELNEILKEVVNNENPVLRSAIASVKSKFVETQDLQQQLLIKVCEIELQRKIIAKLLDEWCMLYPHYLGLMEVKWLKFVFKNTLDKTFLERERWRIITKVKSLIQQAQAPINKYLNEIQMCTQRLQNLIPDEIKKVDTSSFRRVPVSDFAGKISTSANIALGVGTAIDITNMAVRSAAQIPSYLYVNPLLIAVSIKMLTDSYIKDDLQRRDVKIYGFQTLLWWETMMNSLDIAIIETIQGMKNLLEASVQRDKSLLSKAEGEVKLDMQKRISAFLVDEFKKSIAEKFIEIIPEKGVYMSNILENINNMYNKYEERLIAFGNKVVF